MNTRNVLIAAVVVLALVGGMMVITSGQQPTPVAAAPTVSITPATATPTVAPTPTPTVAPTPAPTVAPTPSSFVLSGTVTRSGTGQSLRTAVNVYAATADFCAKYVAAFNTGNFPASVASVTFVGQYTLRGIPPGTYLIVASPREAPGGNWFWRGSNVPTQTCNQGQTVVLDRDQVADFKIPAR